MTKEVDVLIEKLNVIISDCIFGRSLVGREILGPVTEAVREIERLKKKSDRDAISLLNIRLAVLNHSTHDELTFPRGRGKVPDS
jgi:hypothetical protein